MLTLEALVEIPHEGDSGGRGLHQVLHGGVQLALPVVLPGDPVDLLHRLFYRKHGVLRVLKMERNERNSPDMTDLN